MPSGFSRLTAFSVPLKRDPHAHAESTGIHPEWVFPKYALIVWVLTAKEHTRGCYCHHSSAQ
jgi:hypothetical protein